MVRMELLLVYHKTSENKESLRKVVCLCVFVISRFPASPATRDSDGCSRESHGNLRTTVVRSFACWAPLP